MQNDANDRRWMSENVRYCLWKDPAIGPDQRRDWVRILAARSGLAESRVEALFDAEPVDDRELAAVARGLGRDEQDLRYDDLPAAEDMLAENLTYVLGTVEHGGQRRLAAEVGVTETTVFRWKQGTRPRPRQLRALLGALGLPGRTDLSQDRVFLAFRPVTLRQRHARLKELIDRLSPDELAVLMPALERLLERR